MQIQGNSEVILVNIKKQWLETTRLVIAELFLLYHSKDEFSGGHSWGPCSVSADISEEWLPHMSYYF